MRSTKRLLLTVLTLTVLSGSAWTQAADTTPPSRKTKQKPVAEAPAPPAITAADVQALKDGLAAQQQQIQLLTEQLRQAQANWQQAQTAAADAAKKATAVQAQVNQDQQTVGELKSDLADLKTVSLTSSSSPVLTNAVLSLQEPSPNSAEPAQVYNKQMESPITMRFRGINITPGGYAAGEFVRRSKALGADVATPFNSLTMPGASQSHLPEFFGSGRQSKATVFVDGKLDHVDLSSYISTDFVSAGVTSTPTSTNSYTLRLRQAWAQAKFDNGWAFLAGQAWSLATENGKGIAPDDDMGKTNDARPKTIDASYNVGFDYVRQWGLRLTKSYDKVAFAISVENSQGTITTHGNANNYIFSQPGASNSYNTTTTYSFNPSPDIIAKVAFDPGFGHYEVFGLLDRFTDRVFPCEDIVATAHCGGASAAGPNPLGAFNYSKEGGGVGASARWLFAKRLTFGLKGFGGSGIGRYAPGGLPDATINPDGTVRLVKNLHGLGTLELKTKHVDFYSYGGVEYAARTWAIDDGTGTPKTVGYGAPGFNNTGCYTEVAPGTSTSVSGPVSGTLANCTADTRALIEGTIGFWYRLYSGPKGRFQYGTQYSYVTRNAWSGDGSQPNGVDNMIFTSFRYYLP